MDADEKNYRAFLDGDLTGFENLVLKYKDHLIYFLYRYVKDINEAEDLAQDAFVEVYIHKERYHFQSGFKTYLYTIGRNKTIDFIRRQNRHILVEALPEAYKEEEELEEKVIREEEKRIVNQALKQLKQEYQAAILLVDFEELSYKEAARILQKTIPQMKVLIHRARKALKKILEKEGCFYEK